MNVRHRVELSQTERADLTALLSGGKHAARKLKRAQILLAADTGASDDDIATNVGVGGSTVYRTKQRFVLGNLEAALSEAPRPGASRKLSSKEEALLVVFVNSRRMQSVLSRLIEQKFGCRRPEYIRGDTIAGQRQEIVNRFSALEGFAVLILSPRAAGVGLNIVAANHVIHLDRWWNPAVEDQCTDRAYRIGATKDVFVYTVGAVHPVLKESSYDVVLDTLLRTRRETSKRVFTSLEITAADFVGSINSSVHHNGAEETLQEIDKSGYIFLEEFVRDRLLAEGLSANLTRYKGDGGADIVVRDELGEIIYLVQCKHTTNIDTPIDAGLLEDALRVRENWHAKNAVVVGVSNAKRFSPRVVDQFKKINGRLIARDDLWRLRFTG